jgi:DNA repair exonuclease SbcCD nuclease subunit
MPVLIHTSDVHLGAPLGWLGPRAAEQRRHLRRTLSAIVDLALSERADCLLVVGDLFDSNSPPTSDVRFALQEFGRLTAAGNAEVVVLPGSHDFLGRASVYASYRRDFEQVRGLTVLGADGAGSVDLERLRLSIRGNPPRSNRSSGHQMSGLEPHPDLDYSVAALHGSVDVLPIAADDHPIAQSELAGPGWSYFALGHWHSWREIEGAGAPAVYPGAPEVIAVDQLGAGHVARVELTSSGTSVERVRVGTRSIVAVRTDVTDAPDADVVAEEIRGKAPPDRDVILRLSLAGLLAVDSAFDAEALVEALATDYFHVDIAERAYHIRLEDHELLDLPERLVIGRFARLMRAKMVEASTDAERGEIEDALQLGAALLQGKDVLG